MSDDTITPMMAQYLEIKAQYPDAILFYRMGDFYEMFFDDALKAAKALDIALTKRGKHNGEDIPMCGVPAHSAEGYLLALIRKGFRVAIAEQMENPADARKRGYKAVVHRDVVRLVTPGTLTEDSLLEARRHNYLCSYSEMRDSAALAWCDISTGEFQVMSFLPHQLGPELARLAPSELLVSEDLFTNIDPLAQEQGFALTPLPRTNFDSSNAKRKLCDLYQVATLEAFAHFERVEISAMGALIDYLELTQRGKLPLLRPPVREITGDIMQIDAATRRNLEITAALSGGRANSLLAGIDRTITAGGARLLERRLTAPSRDLEQINQRLDAVEYFTQTPLICDALRDFLSHVPDMDRALSRLALDRGGPRDLAMIRNALAQAHQIAGLFDDCPVPLIAGAARNLQGHDEVQQFLEQALVTDPPLLARDGGFIANGFDPRLDDTRRLRDEGRHVIASLQADYVAQTGIQSLKIKHNNVLGYFIETPATHTDKMMAPPLSQTFMHRQTTANQLRFTTLELSELETRILNAAHQTLDIEKQHFTTLRDTVLSAQARISLAARALAELDLYAGLAQLAQNAGWVRPKMDRSTAFHIVKGRHPVVEQALEQDSHRPFIANDCDLTAGNTPAIWLLTGPNMAGKSTFLRQNALIVLLAQMGSYVPAQSAHIGMVSQLFSRVGAADDLARGRSTFMVEMVETAAILNQADSHAFVILDEIGRGTATYDGLSIAWATLEHLHNANRCRAIFATHYHEMTALSAQLSGVSNATVAVKEWQNEVIFLHEIKKGAADRSYGVQVARLAGLPASVIERAKAILHILEQNAPQNAKIQGLMDDLPLFQAALEPKTETPGPSPLEVMLGTIQPDDLSPKEALALIYELKALAG